MLYKTEHLFLTCMQRYIPVHTSLEGPRLPFCKIKHGIINYFKYFEQKNRIEKGFKKQHQLGFIASTSQARFFFQPAISVLKCVWCFLFIIQTALQWGSYESMIHYTNCSQCAYQIQKIPCQKTNKQTKTPNTLTSFTLKNYLNSFHLVSSPPSKTQDILYQ